MTVVRGRRDGFAWLALAALAMVAVLVLPALAHPKPAPSLAGLWKIDPSRTETPFSGEHHSMGGGYGRHGGWGGGGWGGGTGGGWGDGHRGGGGGGGGGGEPGGDPSEGGADGSSGRHGTSRLRPEPLPPVMRVTQHASLMTLADSSGVAVAEIAVGDSASSGASPDTAVTVFAAPHFTGAWKGDQLVITRELADGIVIHDTWTLKSKGRELEIKSTIVRADHPTLEFKRVYQRMEG
jgi:hypothetical protein